MEFHIQLALLPSNTSIYRYLLIELLPPPMMLLLLVDDPAPYAIFNFVYFEMQLFKYGKGEFINITICYIP